MPLTQFPAFYLDRVGTIFDPLKKPGSSVAGNAPIDMSGFAFDTVAKAPSKGVDLEVDGRLYGSTYGSSRPDVAAANKNPALTMTGYKATFAPGALSAGPHEVVVRVLTADGKAYYKSPTIKFTVQ
jgi:hypothetical protein